MGGKEGGDKKIQNDRAKPRSGQKMKERAVETRVRKYGGKKRRLERLKQGQTEREGRERKRQDGGGR